MGMGIRLYALTNIWILFFCLSGFNAATPRPGTRASLSVPSIARVSFIPGYGGRKQLSMDKSSNRKRSLRHQFNFLMPNYRVSLPSNDNLIYKNTGFADFEETSENQKIETKLDSAELQEQTESYSDSNSGALEVTPTASPPDESVTVSTTVASASSVSVTLSTTSPQLRNETSNAKNHSSRIDNTSVLVECQRQASAGEMEARCHNVKMFKMLLKNESFAISTETIDKSDNNVGIGTLGNNFDLGISNSDAELDSSNNDVDVASPNYGVDIVSSENDVVTDIPQNDVDDYLSNKGVDISTISKNLFRTPSSSTPNVHSRRNNIRYPACEVSILRRVLETTQNYSIRQVSRFTIDQPKRQMISISSSGSTCVVYAYSDLNVYGTASGMTEKFRIALTVGLVILFTCMVSFSLLLIRQSRRSISKLNKCSCLLLFFVALFDVLTILFGIAQITYPAVMKSRHSGVLHFDACRPMAVLERLSIVPHTTSLWLTVVLAIHRYLCIRTPFKASSYITIPRTLVVVFVITLAPIIVQAMVFFDSSFEPIVVMKGKPGERYVLSCRQTYAQWLTDPVLYATVYLWIRVSIDKFIPSIVLASFAVATGNGLRKQRVECNLNGHIGIDKKSRRLSIYILIMACAIFTAEFPAGILWCIIAIGISAQHVIIPYKDAKTAFLVMDMYLYLVYFFVFLFYCLMGKRQREALARCFRCRIGVRFDASTISTSDTGISASTR